MKLSRRWFPAKPTPVFFAALAAILASPSLWPQTSTAPTANHPIAGVMPPDASGNATIINQSFTYPDIELWDPKKWPGYRAKVTPVVAWIETHQKNTHPEYVVNAKYKGIENFVGNPDYTWKSQNITDSEITDPLARMGLHIQMRESQSGRDLSVVVTPEKVLTDKEHKAPVLIVPYVVDKRDVFWAMDALVHYKKYNELCARRGDFIIVYAVIDKSVAGRGLISNGTALGNPQKIYLDISVFKENGARVADVPGLDWSDDSGAKSDPDAALEHIDFIPVLNIAGKTDVRPLPGVEIAIRRKDDDDIHFDPQLVIHGLLGQHWMESIRVTYNHGKDNDPALKAHLEEMGLVGGEHDYKGKRYFLYSPRQAADHETKLPLVIVDVSEISHTNQYSLSQTYVPYFDYFKLAGEGDINILAFAFGSQAGGDLGDTPAAFEFDAELVREVEKTSLIDASRVYVTGHSHMGHESREFAYRHPELIAAVAQLGNASGYAAPSYSHETIVADDQRIEAWSKIDMPDITIGAAGEELSPHTMPSLILPDYDLFIEAWQRRLKASRCPMETREQIMAAEHSSDHVTRLYGLPNDGSSLQVIDGVEHYFIDIKNIDGKDHLRIVAVQNMIHIVEPTMPMISWSWMRRFARDQKTGKVIELY
jgi:hypothetical protein